MSLNKCRDVLTPQEGCCELNNPLYEVFHSSRNILGQHSPGAAAACHPSITGNDGGGQAAAAQGWVRAAPSPEGEVFPGLGTPLCPQTQHREVGGRRQSSHAPSGMGTRAHLAQAEGLQVGRGAPEKPSYGTTEGEGQPVPESWHSHPGCQHRPLANAFPAAGLGRSGGAAAESPPAPAGSSAPQRAASCSFPPGLRPLPALSTPASLPLLCQVPPAQPSFLPVQSLMPRKGTSPGDALVPHTCEGNQRGATTARRSSSAAALHPQIWVFASPAPAHRSRCQAPISSILLLLVLPGAAAWVSLPQGSLAREAPRYFNPASPTIPARLAASAAPGEFCPAPPRPAPVQDGGTPRGCAWRSRGGRSALVGTETQGGSCFYPGREFMVMKASAGRGHGNSQLIKVLASVSPW